MKKTTMVTVMSVPPATMINGQRVSSTPEPLYPSPLAEIKERHGSDKAKTAAIKELEAQGYTVRAASFTEKGLVIYVNQIKPTKKAKRSATSRRKK